LRERCIGRVIDVVFVVFVVFIVFVDFVASGQWDQEVVVWDLHVHGGGCGNNMSYLPEKSRVSTAEQRGVATNKHPHVLW
jgi:hypothetical protein